jgi:hypothetical protein
MNRCGIARDRKLGLLFYKLPVILSPMARQRKSNPAPKRGKNDILEEVWQVRDKISAECGHDVRRLFKRLKTLEAQHPERVVSFAPRQTAKPVRKKRHATAK